MRCWIALHTSIITEAAQPVMDETTAQKAVASIALGFTPRVALVDESVLMDVTGSLRLFGGLACLMQLLERQLKVFFESNRLDALTVRTQGATSLIALGRLRVLQEQGARPDAARKRVADLPMHTLTAARAHLGVLERIGCRTWDDLLRLPRDGMARRFDAALLEALDRARGAVADDYAWLVLPEHFEEKLELDALVEHAPALMAGIERLLVKLQAWLLGRQSGLCALKVTWHLDKRRDVAPTGELDIRTANPAQDLRHMTRLVSEHLAQQTLPAPVHSVSLQSLITESLADAAAATGSLLMEARKHGDGALELVERLSARLGDDNVLAWQACADHRPEEMQRWIHARDAIRSMTLPARLAGSRKRGRDEKNPEASAAGTRTDALYPAWLLRQPLRLKSAGESPVYQGALRQLAGPQRLEAPLWLRSGGETRPRVLRDYFIYRSEQGSLLWIFRERLGRPSDTLRQHAWYLHGFFA
ncbi:MAG: DNA polymerase Y family protein [Polaromonas sp.]|uniref:Y-family DNA polymerase n=1 Tax=Polaromonas sp. TaxID=1869339 RepID=UPI0025E0BBF0|nr:DNA polymerase Y family protein [Polaromonas sp.]MBI2725053.1 DNA polymerase Y family protein [Polaromonas sp.]